MKKSLSIVISVYNEELVIPLFWEELSKTINSLPLTPEKIEVLFVNDGSTDGSMSLLDNIASSNSNVKSIHFSRNFGHEAAMLAGIDNATGDAIICMDSDLQHPPASIASMIEKFYEGFEIVTMVRNYRADGGVSKRVTSSLFYWIFNKLSKGQFEPNVSDFFLISRKVANVITSQFNERTRFLRGIVQTIGFKKASIPFVAPNRAAGKSKYSISRLFFFSLSAIATFSHIPLRLGLAVGLIFGFFSLILGIYSIVMKFLGDA